MLGVPLKKDEPPGHNGAMLTLSNGQKIMLDSAGKGLLVKDGDMNVVKDGNEITYQGKTAEIVYNTILPATETSGSSGCRMVQKFGKTQLLPSLIV